MRDSSRNKQTSTRRFAFWVGVTVLVHAELLLLLGVGAYMFLPRDADLAKAFAGRGAGIDSIEVGMLDEDAARKIIAELEKQDEERKAEEAKKEENALKAPGQVVDLPTPREEKRPDDAKFVSEHDSTVQHETKKYGRFEDNARQGDQSGTAAVPRPATPAGDGRLAMRTPDLGKFLKGPGVPGPTARAGRPGSANGAPDPGHLEQGGSIPELGSDARLLKPGGGGSKGGTGPALMPSEEQLARAIGGGTQDALRDVDDG